MKNRKDKEKSATAQEKNTKRSTNSLRDKPKERGETTNEKPRGLSLFELDIEMTLALNQIIDGDGELSPEMDKLYAELVEMAKKKCDGYLYSIVRIESEVEAAKAMISAMNKRVARYLSVADNLRDRLATFMSNQQIEKLIPESRALPVAYLNKGRVKIDYDPARLPEQYVESTVTLTPKKDILKPLIEAGIDIDGVTKTIGNPYITMR